MTDIIKETIDDVEVVTHKSGNYFMPAIHYHNAYEIVILEKGERTYMVNDSLINLIPREVILIKNNILHCSLSGSYVSTSLTFGEKYLQRFFSDEAIEILTECFEKEKIRIRSTDYEKILDLIDSFYNNHNDFILLIKILDILKNNMYREVSEIKFDNQLPANIIDFIGQNYITINSLDEIAETFHISKHYLCRIFKESTGTSVIKYINMLKIQTACNMLTQTDIPLKNIAQNCGFNNLAYFCRVFKNITNSTPSAYKKGQ